MARGEHWWNEPPRWAWTMMVAGLVAIAVMLPFALDRSAPPSGGTTAAATTGPAQPATATATPEPSDAAGSSRVVVIGDSDTGGAGQGATAWPALVEERLSDVAVEPVTTGDSGYVSTTAGQPTLVELVSEADLTDADLVVLFGSRFDASGIADRVSAAAQEAIAAVGVTSQADLVVIGPVWPGGGPPAGVRNNRDVIRAAADAAGVPFVDPLGDGWLSDDTAVVGDDGVHLTDQGRAALADLVQPIVEGALAGRAAPTTAGG